MRYIPENERDSDSNSLWDLPYANGHGNGDDNGDDIPDADDPTNSSGISPDSSDEQGQSGAGMVRPRRPRSPQPPYNHSLLNDELPGYNFIARNPVYGPPERPQEQHNPYHLTNGHVRDTPPLRILSVDEALIWPSHVNHVPNIAVNVPTRRTHRRLFRRGTPAFSQAAIAANRRSRQNDHARPRSPSRIPVRLDNLPSTSSDPGPASNYTGYLDLVDFTLPSSSDDLPESLMSNPDVARFIHPPSLFIQTTLQRPQEELLQSIVAQTAPISTSQFSITNNEQVRNPDQLPCDENPEGSATYALQQMMATLSDPQPIDVRLQHENTRDALSPSISSPNHCEVPTSPPSSQMSDTRSSSVISTSSGMYRMSRDNLTNESDTIDDGSDDSVDYNSSGEGSLSSTPRLVTPEMIDPTVGDEYLNPGKDPFNPQEVVNPGEIARVDSGEVTSLETESCKEAEEELDPELAGWMDRVFLHRNSIDDEEIPGPSGLSLSSTSGSVQLYTGDQHSEEISIPLQAELIINDQIIGSGKCSLSFPSLSEEDFTNLARQNMEISIKYDPETGKPYLSFSIQPENPPNNPSIYRHVSRYLCGEVQAGHSKHVQFSEELVCEHVFEVELAVYSSSEEALVEDVSDESDNEIPDIEDFEFS